MVRFTLLRCHIKRCKHFERESKQIKQHWKNSNQVLKFSLGTSNSDKIIQEKPQNDPFMTKITNTSINAIKNLLPKDYPSSVGPSYLNYVKGQSLATIASSAAMVFSTQSLLLAVGLGVEAIPIAATLNWVIKDGAGQVGGMIFASVVNNRFDADPKRWRLISSLALDFSNLLEILSPLIPGYFLIIASIANIGKNISWLAASASRAAIHKSYIRKENLADVTAKAGSQTIAASMIGTGLGISISAFIGSNWLGIAGCFAGLSFVHLVSVMRSLHYVVLDTFNQQRADIVFDYFLKNHRILSPTEASAKENFFPFLFSTLSKKDPSNPIVIGTKLDVFSSSISELDVLLELFYDQQYILTLKFNQSTKLPSIYLLFFEAASSQQVLKGYYHAFLLSRKLSLFVSPDMYQNWREEELKLNQNDYKPSISVDVITKSLNIVNGETSVDEEKLFAFENVLSGLKEQKWNLDVAFIEANPHRIFF